MSVSVIALLIGILAPALTGAREAGRGVVCASNIRQVQMANDLYAQDHGERCLTGAAGITETNLHRWHGGREHVGEAFDAERGDITPYLDGSGASQRVRACPSMAHTLEDLHERGVGFEAGCGGYGYNSAFAGSERALDRFGNWVIVSDEFGSKRTNFASPTSTVAFADAALAGSELIEYSFVEPRKWPQRPRFRPDPSVHFRHAGRANVAWLDGHVGPEERSYSSKSGVYPGDPGLLGIGWFGEHDDNRLYDYE